MSEEGHNQIAEDVARHEAEIVAISKGLNRVEGKLDEIATAVSSNAGSKDRASIPTLLGVGGLLIAAAALGWPLIDDMRQDAEKSYDRNEQRIERLEGLHAIEVERNNRIERELGGLSMLKDLYIADKLRLTEGRE